MDIQLSGHSGCSITVLEDNSRLIVKKKSYEAGYNQRLYNQYDKQKNYTSNIFCTTPVYQCVEEGDGLLSFSMDFINGKTLAEEMKTIELSKISILGQKLSSVIPQEIKHNAAANDFFHKKIESLEAAVNTDCPELKAAFYKLYSYDWSLASHSQCHGDLTLENIILKDEQLYLIDFLDSFYNTWIIDLAKIFQDVDLYWHYRYEKVICSNLQIRLLCLKESIISAILAHPNGIRIYDTLYHALLLNILRIIPYCKDESTKDWINTKIQYVLGIIETLNH